MSELDVGPERRLFGMMQFLLANRVGTVEVVDHEPRGIVGEGDAVEATVSVAAVLDQLIQDGQIDKERLIGAAAALMVIRDYLRPLPHAYSATSADPVGDDLRVMVDAIRDAGMQL